MEKATATSAMQKALSLPELLACIGRYLEHNHTIIQCLCVCRQWKLQFEPLLWRHFHVAASDSDDTIQPTTALMEQNAHLIRSLTVHEVDPDRHWTFYKNCTQLEDLKIILDPVYVDFASRWSFMAAIVRRLPRLWKISISNPGGEPQHTFYQAIADCPNIIVFETQGYSYKAKDLEAYLRASATHVKRLSSTQEYFDDVQKLPDGLVLQEVRYLDIKEASGLSIDVQLDWISRCPNLIALRWEAMLYLTASQFCRIIPTACPHLTSLHLWTDIGDEEIALILEAMPRVEKLNLSRTEFGDKSMVALRRHFPWLKDLNLQYCYDFTSEFIHEALCSCPNLQSISGDMLNYGDIVASSAPWVCKDLRMFDVGLTLMNTAQEERQEHDRRLANENLFKRLGQLTELQYLSIGIGDDDDVDPMDLPILKTRISLDFLTGLRHVNYFSCKGLFDGLSHRQVEDAVEWMVKHWPKLETLEARILMDVEDGSLGPGRDGAMALLMKHGIKVEEDFGQELDEDYVDYESDEYDIDGLDGYSDLEDDYDEDEYGFEDDGYDYDEDQDGLEDLALYLHQHSLD
ncbi:hypothetical protein EC968_003768 [Mortierella alpina]|nr:hypothetical protein EC968_003768 [Mortierella alpina]